MKKILLLKGTWILIMFGINNSIVIGQDSLALQKNTFITIETGSYQYKDYLMNNLRNDGIGFDLGLNHQRIKDNLLQSLNLNLKYGSLNDKYNKSSFVIGANLKYSLLKTNHLFAYGGHFLYSSKLYENENYDSHHNYWLSFISLGISTSIQKEINENISTSFILSLPLIGFISRPDSDRQFILNEPDLNKFDIIKRMNGNYQFSMLGSNFMYIKAGVAFNLKLKNNKLLTLGYNIYYEQTNLSSKSQFLSHLFSIHYQLSK